MSRCMRCRDRQVHTNNNRKAAKPRLAKAVEKKLAQQANIAAFWVHVIKGEDNTGREGDTVIIDGYFYEFWPDDLFMPPPPP